jgi:aryl-alcohol dehydrogenase-like predicted oxidoreductase
MKYTEIAGRKVSGMSLGTVQLGMNYGIANKEGKPDQTKSFAILDAAFDQGITALDTARGYGDSEEVLGAYFAQNPRNVEKTFITTKLSSGLAPGAPAAEVEKKLIQSVETSLSKLGLKKVNCLMLHAASDMTAQGNLVPKILGNFIREGYTDICGVSVYNPEEAETMLQHDCYQAIQIPMNVFDRRFITSGALEHLYKKGINVFVRSVFLQGLFFLEPDEVMDPDLVSYAVPYIKILRQLSEKAGMSVAHFVVAFLRDIPGITSLVFGVDNPEQVIENWMLFDAAPLEESLRREAEGTFKDINYKVIMAALTKLYASRQPK